VILLIALVAFIGWAAWQRLLGLYECAAITTVLLLYASNSLNRLHTTLASVDTLRYANPVAVFLVPALVPLVRLRPPPARARAVVVALAVAVAQAHEFSNQARALVPYARASRAQLTAERQLIVDGEPFVDQGPGVADPSNAYIARLADAPGWGVAPAWAIEIARGRMRIAVEERNRPIVRHQPDAPPRLSDGRALQSCVRVPAGRAFTIELDAGHMSSIRVQPARSTRVVLRTHDRYGPGVRSVVVSAPIRVVVVTPDRGTPRLSLRSASAAIDVCP
jgi:hypothetical protein